jgi:HK97 family phage prohead protease
MARKVATREAAARALVTFASGSVSVRADTDGDGRNLDGYAYRWGDLTDPWATAEYGPAREGFERGAFADAIAERGGRPFPYLDKHRERGGTVVAGVHFAEDDIGLRYHGRLLDTPAARAYAQEATVNDGVSLELIPGEVRRPDGRTVIHTKVRRLAGLAGEYVPAYRGATVAIRGQEGSMDTKCKDCGAELQLGIAHTCTNSDKPAEGAPAAGEAQSAAERAGAGMIRATMAPDSIRQLVTETVNESVRRLSERGALISRGSDPFADLRGYGSLGELVGAAAKPGASKDLRSYAARAIASRALDDTVSTAGANAGLMTGNLAVRDIAGIVSRGRPAITAFGGPRPLGDATGLSLSWPYFDGTLTDFVGVQSAQKAEITSAPLDIKIATEAILTYAGGTDVAYQLIQRGDPSVLDALARVLLTAYGVVTDAAFVTELESGSVTNDLGEAISAVDFAELVAKAVDTSITVQTATGAPAEFILASSTAFAAAAKLVIAQSNTLVSDPDVDLRQLAVSLGGLPIIHVPSLTAGKFIVSNRLAAAWHEDGPFQASAEDVAKLGRNVAYWGMGAGARYIPAGIVELYDVTP